MYYEFGKFDVYFFQGEIRLIGLQVENSFNSISVLGQMKSLTRIVKSNLTHEKLVHVFRR